MPLEVQKRYVRERIRNPALFHIFRIKTVERHRIVLGCSSKKHKKGRCPKPLQVQAILHPKQEYNIRCRKGRCSVRRHIRSLS